MPTPVLSRAQRSYLDEESRAMLYQGASVNQLAEMFNVRVADVMRKMTGVQPVGVGRQGNPIYRIPDAAKRLVRIDITEKMIIDYMEKLNPKELPPLLNKAFWDAMVTRAKYRESIGELWLTTDVIQVASDVFQSLRMSLLLIPDRLRDEANLDDSRVQRVQEVIDSALDDARERLIGNLTKPSGHRSGVDAEDESTL